MKSLLTRLTETIGDNIAVNINNNILEKLVINKDIDAPVITDFTIKELAEALEKEEPELFKKLGEYVAQSKKLNQIANKRKPKQQPQRGGSSSSTRSRSRSTGSSSGGYGSSRSSSSCGSGSYGGWGSSCGSSSYSRSGC